MNLIPDYRGRIVDSSGFRILGERRIVVADDLAITADDFTLAVARSPAGPSTIPLPTPAEVSDIPGARRFRIYDALGNAGTHNITITGTGGALIDGQSSVVISANWGGIDIEWRGTYWHVTNAGFSAAAAPIAHAASHRAGGSDDLLTAPGIIGAGTPNQMHATQLRLRSVTGGVYVVDAGQVGILANGTTGNATGLQITNGVGRSLVLGLQGWLASSAIGVNPFTFTLADTETFDFDNAGKGGVLIFGSVEGAFGGIITFATTGATSAIALMSSVTTTLGTATKLNVAVSGGKVRFQNLTGGPVSCVGAPFSFLI